eukprot:754204-Hanusia_phi.AAC.2
MRNGDYLPTRMESQADAVNLICNVKTQQNAESTVGVMTMGGRRYPSPLCVTPTNSCESPEVLVTPTHDLGKILTALHNVKITGSCNFCSAIQVAQLALKHRQNKNQRQRIVAFVGSPLEDDQKDLVKLGKKLKKNDVAVDVVNFGETAENQEKLEAFIGAVNKNENSNLLTVPPGPHILSDIIISSTICNDKDNQGMMGAGMGGSSMGGGFEYTDDAMYPDLAMALRISAEEERQRQEREAKKAAEEGKPAEGGSTEPAAATAQEGSMYEDDDDMLQQALAMSMQQAQPNASMTQSAKEDTSAKATGGAEPMEEDDELQKALQLSMAGDGGSSAAAQGLLQNAEFLTNVLSSLPGVDTSDPRVQGVLVGMKGEDGEKKGDGKSSDEKKDDEMKDGAK